MIRNIPGPPAPHESPDAPFDFNSVPTELQEEIFAYIALSIPKEKSPLWVCRQWSVKIWEMGIIIDASLHYISRMMHRDVISHARHIRVHPLHVLEELAKPPHSIACSMPSLTTMTMDGDCVVTHDEQVVCRSLFMLAAPRLTELILPVASVPLLPASLPELVTLRIRLGAPYAKEIEFIDKELWAAAPKLHLPQLSTLYFPNVMYYPYQVDVNFSLIIHQCSETLQSVHCPSWMLEKLPVLPQLLELTLYDSPSGHTIRTIDLQHVSTRFSKLTSIKCLAKTITSIRNPLQPQSSPHLKRLDLRLLGVTDLVEVFPHMLEDLSRHLPDLERIYNVDVRMDVLNQAWPTLSNRCKLMMLLARHASCDNWSHTSMMALLHVKIQPARMEAHWEALAAILPITSAVFDEVLEFCHKWKTYGYWSWWLARSLELFPALRTPYALGVVFQLEQSPESATPLLSNIVGWGLPLKQPLPKSGLLPIVYYVQNLREREPSLFELLLKAGVDLKSYQGSVRAITYVMVDEKLFQTALGSIGTLPNSLHGRTILHQLSEVVGPQFGVSIRALATAMTRLDITVDEEDDYARTPLYYAIERGKFNYAQQLLQLGASALGLDLYSNNVLHLICKFIKQYSADPLAASGLVMWAKMNFNLSWITPNSRGFRPFDLLPWFCMDSADSWAVVADVVNVLIPQMSPRERMLLRKIAAAHGASGFQLDAG